MRLVLDTNVVLSALLWRGAPHHLFEAARQQEQIELLTTMELLGELADILGRPSPAKRLAIIGRTARQVIADYMDAAELVIPDAVPRIVPDDPDYDQVIAAAVAGEADIIVSGDHHLLSLGSHKTIRILAPADAPAAVRA